MSLLWMIFVSLRTGYQPLDEPNKVDTTSTDCNYHSLSRPLHSEMHSTPSDDNAHYRRPHYSSSGLLKAYYRIDHAVWRRMLLASWVPARVGKGASAEARISRSELHTERMIAFVKEVPNDWFLPIPLLSHFTDEVASYLSESINDPWSECVVSISTFLTSRPSRSSPAKQAAKRLGKPLSFLHRSDVLGSGEQVPCR